jgi:hypothetical protein
MHVGACVAITVQSLNACGCLCCHRTESECMWVLVLPSMPKGEIVGKYLIDNECLSLMASVVMKMA